MKRVYCFLGTKVPRLVLLLSCLPLLTMTIAAQSTISNVTYGTPQGLEPGAPTGSYALSGLESINGYNSHLNFSVPLLTLGGRGAASYTIMQNITPPGWTVENNLTAINCGYQDPGAPPCLTWLSTAHRNWKVSYYFGAGYGPGVLQGRRAGTNPQNPYNPNDPPNLYGSTFTYLEFTMPDGTEHALYDERNLNVREFSCNYSPNPPYACNPPENWPANRGKVFSSRDGAGLTFISDADIYDHDAIDLYDSGFDVFLVSGYLLTNDGTRYRILNGLVQWIRDRNGNQLTFSYTNSNYYLYLTKITDSLNREVNIEYGYADVAPYGVCDRIKFKGFGGDERIIRIQGSRVQNALRTGYYMNQSDNPFNLSGGGNAYNEGVTSTIWLPDGQRSYRFYYNPYGELARVELPTGGAFEYDYAGGVTGGYPSGRVGQDTFGVYYSNPPPPVPTIYIYRRLAERRTYPDGATGNAYQIRSTFSNPENIPNATTYTFSDVGYAEEEQYDAGGTLLGYQKHYYYGSPAKEMYYPPYQFEGYPSNVDQDKERLTETYKTDRISLILSVAKTWGASVISESNTTLGDTNQKSKQHFDYDQYNNLTDRWEYDYEVGSPGPLIRHTRTEYLTTNSINGAAYASINPNSTNPDSNATFHLRSLPTLIKVYDGGNNLKAQTSFEYDNYNQGGSDVFHAPLQNEAGISALVSRTGLNATQGYAPTADDKRGNVTMMTSYQITNGLVPDCVSSSAQCISAYSQYDIAGNVVKAIDPRSTSSNIIATTLDYRDNFGAPGDVVQTGGAPANVPPIELSSQASYALPFAVTNAMGHTSYTKYDYYLGRAVGVEDPNGVRSRIYYNDLLDRPKKAQRALGTSDLSQTTFDYDDVNRVITTASDQTIFGDGVLVGKSFYDGLGRTTETRQYEDGGRYIALQTQYDALGRASKTSNPFRPLAPDYQTPSWTITDYDALSRVKSVTTPDTAVVNTYYNGNQVLVKDQAGKERMSRTSALGQLTDVWEITSADQWTEGVSFPGHGEVTTGYHTSYAYDTLDNLRTVTQGTQPARTFTYDSLKRLTSAWNPESGTVCYGTVVNGQCQANGYDANGNLLFKTDARGILNTYVYDALNRNTTVDYSNTSINPDIIRSYDASVNGKGRLSSGSASGSYAGTTTLDFYVVDSYDALGRPKVQRQLFSTNGVQQGSYQVQRSYDLAGHVLLQTTYPAGRTVNYSYDAAGRTSSFSGQLGDGVQRTYSSEMNYSPLGGMTKEQFGTDTAVYNKLYYNSRGQLAEIRATTSDTGSSDPTWDRGKFINWYSLQCGGPTCNAADNNGNLRKQETSIPNAGSGYQQYDYDKLNRLQRAHEYTGNTSVDWQQEYVYDRWGNRTIHQTNTWGSNIPKPNFGLDPANNNRLTAPAGYTMSYDNAGNLTNDTYTGAGSRTYDAENRMKTAWGGNNQEQVYTYNADGQRVRRKVNGIETWQVYGFDGELLAEYAANGGSAPPQKEYGYRNGQLLVEVTATTAGWGSPPVLDDNPLVVNVTTVRSLHINQLRTAINALRTHMGMSNYTWVYSATTSDWISANPILEMRIALNQALGAPSAPYSAGLAYGEPIKKDHIQELRDRVLAAWITGTGGVDFRWLVTDQLGTPRIIIDKTGALANVKRHDYLPFGEELFAGTGGRTTAQGYVGDNVRQKFTRKERDIETGLDYFGARYYASTQGRFTSADPLLSSGTIYDPQTWNRYSYTLNNPLKYVDPLGLYEWDANATDEQKKRFRQSLLDVEKARDKFKVGSDKYNRLNDARNAYGTEGQKNGVTVGFEKFTGKDKNIGGKTSPPDFNFENNAFTSTLTVTINTSTLNDRNGLAVVTAHEGEHVADAKAFTDALTKDWSEANPLSANATGGPLNLNGYQREFRGYEITSFMLEAQGNNDSNYEGVKLWDSGWKEPDKATLKRTEAINKFLEKSSAYPNSRPSNPGRRYIEP